MTRFTLASAMALAVLASSSLAADLLPAGSDWVVESGGQEIGDLSVSATGSLRQYNDNPRTNHPPNTSGAWALNDQGTGYGNGGGHTVEFTDNGDGTYSWEKKDNETGAVLDKGTLKPVKP